MRFTISTIVLLALGSISSFASGIDLKKGQNIPVGGPRSVTKSPTVIADVTDKTVTSSIQQFDGVAYVYICDEYGNVVEECSFEVDDSYTFSLSLEEDGNYTIRYEVGNFYFVGDFSVQTGGDVE